MQHQIATATLNWRPSFVTLSGRHCSTFPTFPYSPPIGNLNPSPPVSFISRPHRLSRVIMSQRQFSRVAVVSVSSELRNVGLARRKFVQQFAMSRNPDRILLDSAVSDGSDNRLSNKTICSTLEGRKKSTFCSPILASGQICINFYLAHSSENISNRLTTNFYVPIALSPWLGDFVDLKMIAACIPRPMTQMLEYFPH